MVGKNPPLTLIVLRKERHVYTTASLRYYMKSKNISRILIEICSVGIHDGEKIISFEQIS